MRSSLRDLGYVNIGLDDGWQECRSDETYAYHSAVGRPLFDEKRFPRVQETKTETWAARLLMESAPGVGGSNTHDAWETTALFTACTFKALAPKKMMQCEKAEIKAFPPGRR